MLISEDEKAGLFSCHGRNSEQYTRGQKIPNNWTCMVIWPILSISCPPDV